MQQSKPVGVFSDTAAHARKLSKSKETYVCLYKPAHACLLMRNIRMFRMSKTYVFKLQACSCIRAPLEMHASV